MTRDEVIHVWHRCGACGVQPISGIRFECQTCASGPDNSLCATCYGRFKNKSLNHPTHVSPRFGNTSRPHLFRPASGHQQVYFEEWLAIPQPSTSAPVVPGHFVLRPEFCCQSESFFGGHSFVVEMEGSGSLLLLTALHVMDELIKSRSIDCSPKNLSYTGRELPEVVDGLKLYDVCSNQWMCEEIGSANVMLILPEARTGEEEPYCQRDIAAFWVDAASTFAPAKLATRPPNVGEPIWLAARSRLTGVGQTYEAVVVEHTPRTLIFKFSSAPDPQYGSGAPLLNSKGQVVGINIGAGVLNGLHFGHANHVTSIRSQLILLAD